MTLSTIFVANARRLERNFHFSYCHRFTCWKSSDGTERRYWNWALRIRGSRTNNISSNNWWRMFWSFGSNDFYRCWGKKTSSSTSKRKCIFNQQWLKDPTYEQFLRKCPANKHFAHCSICKSDFSIANGGTYLLNRHMEQAAHKRLAEIQLNERCKV